MDTVLHVSSTSSSPYNNTNRHERAYDSDISKQSTQSGMVSTRKSLKSPLKTLMTKVNEIQQDHDELHPQFTRNRRSNRR